MIRVVPTALLALALIASCAQAQIAGPTSGAQAEKPAPPSVALCKSAALATLSAREPEIEDIYIDEDGATIAVAETLLPWRTNPDGRAAQGSPTRPDRQRAARRAPAWR